MYYLKEHSCSPAASLSTSYQISFSQVTRKAKKFCNHWRPAWSSPFQRHWDDKVRRSSLVLLWFILSRESCTGEISTQTRLIHHFNSSNTLGKAGAAREGTDLLFRATASHLSADGRREEDGALIVLTVFNAHYIQADVFWTHMGLNSLKLLLHWAAAGFFHVQRREQSFWRVWSTSLMKSSWRNWGCLTWRKKDSRGTILLSTASWQEAAARWGSVCFPR